MRRINLVIVGVSLLLAPVIAQQAQNQEPAKDWSKIAGNFGDVKVLSNGGSVVRDAAGHPDLTGRYYPNRAGRMLQGGYRLPDEVMRQYDPKVTPQENPVFKAETKDKYQFPTPYGICPPGGTPTSITTQATEHGPMELVQKDGVLWILTEFPQTIRRIPLDGRPHSKIPDPSFNGESIGHWETDTLVIDTIAIDERMRNISVGRTGDAGAWTHSKQEHVVERFTRTSKNYLTYQLTVTDPVVLVKPFNSAPMTWTLAQDPNDVFTEYTCTANEEPGHYQNLDENFRKTYETGGQDPRQ